MNFFNTKKLGYYKQLAYLHHIIGRNATPVLFKGLAQPKPLQTAVWNLTLRRCCFKSLVWQTGVLYTRSCIFPQIW